MTFPVNTKLNHNYILINKYPETNVEYGKSYCETTI